MNNSVALNLTIYNDPARRILQAFDKQLEILFIVFDDR